MVLTLSIDRAFDPETALVRCFLDGVEINEAFSFDTVTSDADITTQVTANLTAKEYDLT